MSRTKGYLVAENGRDDSIGACVVLALLLLRGFWCFGVEQAPR
jgi:hypothetical protein